MGETHRPLPDRHAGGQVDRNRPRRRGAPGAGSARILSLRTLVAFSLPLGLGALALQTPQRTPAAAQSALAGYVAGQVTSRDGGRPIPGALVEANPVELVAITDGEGRFAWSEIPMSEASLPVTIRIRAEGFGEWTIQDVQLVANDRLLIDAQLSVEPTLIVIPAPRAERPDWPERAPGAREPLLPSATDQTSLPLPETIRVRITEPPYWPNCYPNAPYTVEVVDFKEYAKHVLPNEWIRTWPWESLRAGAVAVKMYAWSYVAVGGKWPDADVFDSTCDQVYNSAVSYDSTNQAVEFTWNWRLLRGTSLVRAFYRALYSQCVGAGLAGNCMGQWETKYMAEGSNGWPVMTWDQMLLYFYSTSYLTPIMLPPSSGFALRYYGNGWGDIDRVKISLDSPHRPADVDGDFTLEWWMRALPGENASSAAQCSGDGWILGNILFDRDVFGSGDLGDYGVSLSSGRLVFGVNNGAEGNTICGARVVADGQWHHVAVTRSVSGPLAIFVDGVLDGQGSGPAGPISYRDGRSTSYPNDPYLVIGAEKHDAGPAYPSFSGWVDEVRISDSVRYTADFERPTAPFQTDAETVALYHFDEGRGNTIGDASGAAGGPSEGVRNYGGDPVNGPEWVMSDWTLFYRLFIPLIQK